MISNYKNDEYRVHTTIPMELWREVCAHGDTKNLDGIMRAALVERYTE